MADKAILYDTTKCTACRGCQVACKQWNETDEYIPAPDGKTAIEAKNSGSYENPPDLSFNTWLKMEFREVEVGDRVHWLFTRRSCMHCTDAACVKVCPVGALTHHELGFVAHDRVTCIGCGRCMAACPFSVPRVGQDATGAAKAAKCTLCTTSGMNRIAEGLSPACVKTCPTRALVYGDRAELVTTANQRIQALKDKGWTKANLFGEKEYGGLHVLYLLDNPPSVYGVGIKSGDTSGVFVAPKETVSPDGGGTNWAKLFPPIGYGLGAALVLGLGIRWVFARKAKKKEEENSKS
jgi:formate dehydrogenase iron-sulfur subunit